MIEEKLEVDWNIINNSAQVEDLKRFLDFKCDASIFNIDTDVLYFVDMLEKNVLFDLCIIEDVGVEDQIRSVIKLTTKIFKQACKGEVTDIRKFTEFVEIDLMTSKETKTIKLPKHLEYQIEYLRTGDILYAEPSMGVIRKLGRSENMRNECDLEGDRYLQLNKTTVCTEKEKEIKFTLKELDNALGSNEKTDKYIAENMDTVEVENIFVFVKTSLCESSMRILNKYAMENKHVKFLCLNADKVHPMLGVRLECNNFYEILVHHFKNTEKEKLLEEMKEFIAQKINNSNLKAVIKVFNTVNTKEDVEKRLKLFL